MASNRTADRALERLGATRAAPLPPKTKVPRKEIQ